MIGKQTKGRGFRGTLSYVLGKDGAEIIGGNMLGTTPRDLAAEFAEARKLKPNLSRAVYHASLSLPPGENMNDDNWRTVADKYMNGMGFDGSQYVVAKHTDTEHAHVHIVASRIRMDGSVVNESHDYRRSEEKIREIERDFQLTPTLPSHQAIARAPSSGELQKALKEGRPSTKLRLQNILDRAAGGGPTMSVFVAHLETKGVAVIPNVAKTGHMTGISFRLDGELMKGSDLGRSYSWKGLQQKGVSFEQIRDFQTISEAGQRAKSIAERTTNPRSDASSRTIGRNLGGDSRLTGERQIQGGGSVSGNNGAHGGGFESLREGNNSRSGGSSKNRQFHRDFSASHGAGYSKDDRRRAQEGPVDHTGLEGGLGKTERENHLGGIARVDSRGSGSREHLLRAAAELLRGKGGGRKLEDIHREGISTFEFERARQHQSDLRIIENALKPFDDEKEKIRLEKEEVQGRQIELRRSRSKKRGPSLSL
jgi:hypothetical protein